MNMVTGWLGAGSGFLLSALLVGVFPAVFGSYQLLNLLYSLGIFRDEMAFAGNFPDPVMSAVGRILLSLALTCFILATLFYFLRRVK